MLHEFVNFISRNHPVPARSAQKHVYPYISYVPFSLCKNSYPRVNLAKITFQVATWHHHARGARSRRHSDSETRQW